MNMKGRILPAVGALLLWSWVGVAPASATTLSMVDVVRLARDVGVPTDQLAIAGAIARAESGFDTTAVNPNGPTSGCPNGSRDRGLWQLNDCYQNYAQACAFDAACNARAMVDISNHGVTWRPWSTYTNGAYRAYLAEAQQAVATVTGSAPPPLTPPGLALVQYGDRGPVVVRIQRALGIAADGEFGPQTQGAVGGFQRSAGLGADGVVGPRTAAALAGVSGGATLRGGSSGPAVARVQRALGIAADGAFGPQTRQALTRFQQAVGVAADGVVGPQTAAALFASGQGAPAPPSAAPAAPLVRVGDQGAMVARIQRALGVAADWRVRRTDPGRRPRLPTGGPPVGRRHRRPADGQRAGRDERWRDAAGRPPWLRRGPRAARAGRPRRRALRSADTGGRAGLPADARVASRRGRRAADRRAALRVAGWADGRGRGPSPAVRGAAPCVSCRLGPPAFQT